MVELTWKDLAPYVAARVAEKFPADKEFARLIGEIPATVSLWLHAKREPRLKALYRMATALEMPIGEFLSLPEGVVPQKRKPGKKTPTDVRVRVVETKVAELSKQLARLTAAFESFAGPEALKAAEEKVPMRIRATAGAPRGR